MKIFGDYREWGEGGRDEPAGSLVPGKAAAGASLDDRGC
jgi:hypothetical protein